MIPRLLCRKGDIGGLHHGRGWPRARPSTTPKLLDLRVIQRRYAGNDGQGIGKSSAIKTVRKKETVDVD